MAIKLNGYSNFIFDFDGVIVDSVNIKTEAFAQLYSEFGERVVKKVISHHLSHGGVDRFSKIRYYHQEFLKKELSRRQLQILARRFSNLVFKKILKANFIGGALEFLNLLKKQNKRMFLISATPEDELKRIIVKRKLSKFFTDLKGAPSRKKENLNFIIKKYKLKPEDCVYFGDSQEDLNAANCFGPIFIPINFYKRNFGYKDFTNFINT
ncbi:MAG: HAD-IA family hydrolase [Candidatus Omnitrophota bacterium]|nr:HAD-IA family hydrolase [Candidatus Omnitrophota bacterium]